MKIKLINIILGTLIGLMALSLVGLFVIFIAEIWIEDKTELFSKLANSFLGLLVFSLFSGIVIVNVTDYDKK